MSYESILKCIQALGVANTFSPKALEILSEYSDAGEDVLYPLIILLGDEAFTTKAKEYFKKNNLT